MPAQTTTYEETTRSDFGITYYTTEGRPKVEYTNEVPPEVMRTLSFEKVLYDTNGHRLSDEDAAKVKAAFNFRLYLGNEFAEQENLLPADMYTYYIKGPDHTYCRWDKTANKDEGGSVSVSGRTYSGTERTENYTANYQVGGSTGHNENIRTDTVTNSRPGIQIYKTDWNGDNYLSGAVFTLKDSDGHDVGHATYTSDTDGLVTTAYLNEGIFTLKMINLFQNFLKKYWIFEFEGVY